MTGNYAIKLYVGNTSTTSRDNCNETSRGPRAPGKTVNVAFFQSETIFLGATSVKNDTVAQFTIAGIFTTELTISFRR